jgi:two-component system nitrogen regulation response regulator GlnG
MPEGLIESELFGHERGAFTGADRQRIGKFEQCDGGTLFLDEIGDMPLPAQAKVLRLLQEQQFERVGGRETISTHVRIIAATNQDLEKRIAEGYFRADLFYRLRGVTVAVPPLRERPDDIPELAHYYLFLFNQELGLNLQGFDPEALSCLRHYRWPGNVRELQSVLKESMLRTTGPLVLPEFLPPGLLAQPQTRASSGSDTERMDVQSLIEELLKRGQGDLHSQMIAIVERALFKKVLLETEGHMGRACERLGLNRSTLRYKLRDLGMSIDRVVGE